MSENPNPNASVGALEVGSLVMTYFFGIVTVQTYHYYCRYTADSLWMKCFVASIWLVEAAHSISVAYSMYETSVTQFGQKSAESLNPFPAGFALSILFSGFLGPLVQAFFAHRVHVFSKQIYIPILCWTLSALRLLGSIVGAGYALKTTSLQEFGDTFSWLITVLLVMGAVNDTIIAGSLCYYLRRERAFALGRTAKLLDQLIAYTIETGVITSLTAVTIFICFKTMPNNLSWFGMYLFFGEVFANVLLASLNARRVHPDSGQTVISLTRTYLVNEDLADAGRHGTSLDHETECKRGSFGVASHAAQNNASPSRTFMPQFSPDFVIEVSRDMQLRQDVVSDDEDNVSDARALRSFPLDKISQDCDV
ncbi:hypothetical protein BV22DRAFT_1041994 [Leucogyrophana mollusca]|uniref:Uncharacterized protein n=1 Tax=Leucogyrophana mollusca TaxID=85980 RepID=A0ACB8AX26_9AGAM|nr:hypothetical protein BV22DRAFT_1041994 [Leucogyrophana mollusca]